MINSDNAELQENINPSKRIKPRITQVKKTGLAQFSIKIKKHSAGGEIVCVWSGKTYQFNDINELLRFIEKECDAVWYPQAQRKLRDWNMDI